MEFVKLKEGRYALELDSKIDDEIYEMLFTLSLNELSKFETTTNSRLYDTLVARRVGSEFFKQNMVLPPLGFCVVEVKTNHYSKNLEVSIGKLPIEDEEIRVSGPLYL